MHKARIRFALALAVFLGWIGWLGWLAFGTQHQIVLSRPQFLVANVHAVATLSGDAEYADGAAVIDEVLWRSDPTAKIATGARLHIADLELCGAHNGWGGPGRYILALTWRKDNVALTQIPSSPGFPLISEQPAGHREIVAMRIDMQNKITNALEEVTDPARIAAARVRLRRLQANAKLLERQANALPEPTPELKTALAKAGYEERFQTSLSKMLTELQRVQKIDGGDELIMSLRTLDGTEDDRLRIYPANERTLAQLEHIENEWK